MLDAVTNDLNPVNMRTLMKARLLGVLGALLLAMMGGQAGAQALQIPPGQMVATRTIAQTCPVGAQILAFEESRFQLNDVVFAFNPSPAHNFNGSAAIGALYGVRFLDGTQQGQFCFEGVCLAGQNQCAAIAFIQPNGVRVYQRVN